MIVIDAVCVAEHIRHMRGSSESGKFIGESLRHLTCDTSSAPASLTLALVLLRFRFRFLFLSRALNVSLHKRTSVPSRESIGACSACSTLRYDDGRTVVAMSFLMSSNTMAVFDAAERSRANLQSLRAVFLL
jgi:hypothetical protein